MSESSRKGESKRTMYPYNSTAHPAVSVRAKFLLALSFAFIAGFVDVICLVRYKALPSMMTGNIIQLGRSAVEEIDAMFLIVLISCRMGGLAIHYFAEKVFAYGTTLVAPVLGFIIICLEYKHYKGMYVDGIGPMFDRKYDLLFLAPVFGVQQAVSMQGCLACPTTLATGHLMNLTYNIIDFVQGKTLNDVKKITKFACDCAIVLGLALGALAGSFANTNLKGSMFHDFLLSMAVLPLIVLFSVDDFLSTPVIRDKSGREIGFIKKIFLPPPPEKED